jgi:hypothetical protein
VMPGSSRFKAGSGSAASNEVNFPVAVSTDMAARLAA